MIALLVMTDGRREYLTQAIDSLGMLDGPVSVRVIHDDSGDAEFAAWLWEIYGDRFVVHSTGKRQGFAGAMRSARAWIAEHDRSPFVWWHEDDFILLRPVPVAEIADVLDWHPHLVQMALERQPINDRELAAGGVVRQWWPDVQDVEWSGAHWREQRRCFTTNPSLLPRATITDYEWPQGSESEGRFGVDLYASNNALAGGYWGADTDGPWTVHIGTRRAGSGY